MKGRRFLSILALLVYYTFAAQAQEQSRTVIENTILGYLDVLYQYQGDTSKNGLMNLMTGNAQLMAYLKNICIRQPNTLQEEFHHLGDIDGDMKGMNITTSADKKVRIYCWDTRTASKGLHRFNALAQFVSGDSIVCKHLSDINEAPGQMGHPNALYAEICTVDADDDKPLYLLLSHSINSGKEGAHTVQAYTITEGELVPVPAFEKNGGLNNTIRVDRDKPPYGEWAEDDTNIKISPDGDYLYIPIVKKETAKGERHTKDKSYHVYKFNGRRFVYKD